MPSFFGSCLVIFLFTVLLIECSVVSKKRMERSPPLESKRENKLPLPSAIPIAPQATQYEEFVMPVDLPNSIYIAIQNQSKIIINTDYMAALIDQVTGNNQNASAKAIEQIHSKSLLPYASIIYESLSKLKPWQACIWFITVKNELFRNQLLFMAVKGRNVKLTAMFLEWVHEKPLRALSYNHFDDDDIEFLKSKKNEMIRIYDEELGPN